MDRGNRLTEEQELSFVFGRAYGAFFGASGQNEFQQNAAFQIVMSKSDITVIDESDEKYIGNIILIKPLVKSKFQCDGSFTYLYLSPRIDFTLDLIKLVGDRCIHTPDNAGLMPFNERSMGHEVITALNALDQSTTQKLDPRLVAVLEDLNQNLDNPSILDAAKRSGLSRSRVRTLAREQMGLPLSTWVTWRKLIKANKAMSNGANLSEAALAGSFADQAHFTRTMKRMCGITPNKAVRVYT